MGVKVKEWKGAWWVFINHKGRRKTKRVGVGKEGQRAARIAAEKIQAKLALGETGLLDETRTSVATGRNLYATSMLAKENQEG